MLKRSITAKSDTHSPTNLGLGGFTDKDDLPDEELSKIEDRILDKKISEWVNKQYKACKDDAFTVRNQWYLNLGFYKGDQYITLSSTGKLMKAPNVPGRMKLVINRIRPAVRTEISRLSAQKVQVSVVPASTEDEDIIAAEAGEQIWEYLYEKEKVDSIFAQASFWVATCGIGYVKVMWDENATYSMGGSDTPEIKGCIHYEAPTPFHIFVPDSMEKDIQRQPFVLHAYTMGIEEVKERFGDKLDKDHLPSTVSTNEIFETRHMNIRSAEESAKPDSCLVIEAWVKPHTTNFMPNGGMVIVVDKTVVYKDTEGIPYDHGKFPFVKMDNVPSGTYYSTSTVEDLISLQKELNRNRSQVVENRNATAKPGYFVQAGSVDTNKWTSKPGQLIPILPGFQNPQPMQVPQLPAYVAQEHENFLRDIEDISGQHQVSKGNTPAGVTAATAINFLQERDDSYMAPAYVSVEEANEEVASQTLQLVVQFWDEERMVKATGSDMAFSSQAFRGADIKNATDVRAESGSALPVSKAGRQAMIMDMMNRGLIPPDKGLEMMELPNMRAYYELVKRDERHATRENIKLSNVPDELIEQSLAQADALKQQFLMQTGMDEMTARTDPQTAQILDQWDEPMLPVNEWDNDEVHIFVHEGFMKTQRFETLSKAKQDQFIRHVEAHRKKMQTAMLTQFMQGGVNAGDPTQMMQGAGATNGGANAGGSTSMEAPQPQEAGTGQPQ